MTNTDLKNPTLSHESKHGPTSRASFGARFWAFLAKNPDLASAVSATMGVSRG